jgi:hypothetical protein
MGKHTNKTSGETKMNLIFATVTKEIGEGEAKQTVTLKYNPGTERFDLHKDKNLIISSCCLNDCVLAAEGLKISFSPEEKKIGYKPVG